MRNARTARLWSAGVLFAVQLALFPIAVSEAQSLANAHMRENANGILTSSIVYHEPSGSYFQLVRDTVTGLTRNGVSWSKANLNSASYSHQGRKGRLAIIDSPELQEWLLTRFDFADGPHEGIWIGLRYWCSTNMLTTSDGRIYDRKTFVYWDTPWNRNDGIACGKTPNLEYMGIYIARASLRWKATGDKKAYTDYLIEYPPSAKDQGEAE